jgi:hypothetical protein
MPGGDSRPLKLLLAALGDDPARIAECLARPLLADRLVREWYAGDERFHGALRVRAEAELAGLGTPAGMPRMSGTYAEVEWTRMTTPTGALSAAALAPQEWAARQQDLARLFGRPEPPVGP